MGPSTLSEVDLRCPGCGRLLARRLEEAGFEVRVAGRRVLVRDGELECDRCGTVVEVSRAVERAVERRVSVVWGSRRAT